MDTCKKRRINQERLGLFLHFKNRYTQVGLAIGISFLLLMSVRLFLYFSYPDYFSNLNISERFLENS